MSVLAPHPADRIGALARVEPELLLTAGDNDNAVVGAVWSHAPVVAEVTGLAQHAIVLHLSGSTLVERWRQGRLVGHRSRVGSVSLVPAQVASTWVLTGHSRVAHVYVDPARLAAMAETIEGAPASGALRDFFAESDEVTASLVRLMLAQVRAGTLDRLAHDEVTALLARHLLHRYAEHGPIAPVEPRGATLTAATLRRLFDHVENCLAGDLRLAGLAALAHLSEDHFLRAFKRAVGMTPHRYVLTRRIAAAQSRLQGSAMPVAEIAHATGFRGASHFAAAFRQQVGASPTEWRGQRRH